MSYSSNTFVNWSENIQTKEVILHPKSDDEIIKLIQECHENKKCLRVVGSRHSISPVIINQDEEDTVLISLDQYQLEPKNIDLNLDQMRVRVNAGWTLGQLYDYLDKESCILPTQPASSAFTVGGVINIPVHGSRLGRSFIGEHVLALTFIDHHGHHCVKTIDDDDFHEYLYTFGSLGVVTSVVFPVERCYNTLSTIREHNNIFLKQDGRYKVNSNLADPIFTRLIEECLRDNSRGYYHHSFLDLHNNSFLCLDWHLEDSPALMKIDRPETRSIYKIKLAKFFHTHIFSSYRRHKWYLRLLGKMSKWMITSAVRMDNLDDHNMFWFSVGSAAYFMEYFIPIQEADEPLDLSKLYQALEILKNEVEIARGGHFNLDLPVSLRLITANSNHSLSPIATDVKTVYLGLDLVCGVPNLSLNQDKVRSGYQQLNTEFRRFFARLEHHWQEMDGRPHPGKIAGFHDDADPFTDYHALQKGVNPTLLRSIQEKSHPVFRNSYLQRLLNVE